MQAKFARYWTTIRTLTAVVPPGFGALMPRATFKTRLSNTEMSDVRTSLTVEVPLGRTLN